MASLVKTVRMSKHMLRTLVVFASNKRHATLCTSSTLLLRRSPSCTMDGTSKTASNMASSKEPLQNRFDWLKNHAPCFGMNGDDVTVINDPIDFCETFKSMTRQATRRIVIASLYLGTGAQEEALVDSIREACTKAKESENDKFEVHILLDFIRGSRGGDRSSRTMLTPLLEKFADNVHVYLYHTPDLRGWLKKYVPERFNETIGVHHMKIYLADDDFIISGANLSETYFTNRQDRYIQFRSCPEMADYFINLVEAVSQFSFHLQSDNTTTYPPDAPHPYEGPDVKVFKDFARQTVLKATQDFKLNNGTTCKIKTIPATTSANKNVDTWLYPLIQMGPFQIVDDETVTKLLLTQSEQDDQILLTSGYFNLTSQYMNVVLNDSKASFEILAAAPEANGFYGAHGVSGHVPLAFTYLAKQFYSHMLALGQETRIAMHEYYRAHWTYHCKGLWYYLPNSSLPALTLIGSPNFGHRSVYRDLECQVAVMTTNNGLQHQLKQEHVRLYDSSTRVTMKTFQSPQRYVPFWARLVTKIIKSML